MSNPTYEIEATPPQATHCDCCDGLTVRLTRFVRRDGIACAVYYAVYSNNHPENEIHILVSIGRWGEGSQPAQRDAFFGIVRPNNESYGVMLADADSSPWRDVELVGRKLSRNEALAHPAKASVFEIIDEAFVQDPSVGGFLARVQCGSVSTPLEFGFGSPDVIFDLGPNTEGRVEQQGQLVSLDQHRFFVRSLLQIRVEHYGSWAVGLWVEVSADDYRKMCEIWSDRERYLALSAEGTIANQHDEKVELPYQLGDRVTLRVDDADRPPRITPQPGSELAQVMNRIWERDAFEQFALARGFL